MNIFQTKLGGGFPFSAQQFWEKGIQMIHTNMRESGRLVIANNTEFITEKMHVSFYSFCGCDSCHWVLIYCRGLSEWQTELNLMWNVVGGREAQYSRNQTCITEKTTPPSGLQLTVFISCKV